MCNLYSITRTQEAMRRLFRVKRDFLGNFPGLPAVFPDSMAPVVRTARDGERELTMMRWGFPPPPNFGNAPVTNVRNLKSPYWHGWLKAEWRCLVPATSFCEWTDTRPKVTHWFALDENRPIFAFAGVWRLWTGECKGRERRASTLRISNNRIELYCCAYPCQGHAGAFDSRARMGCMAYWVRRGSDCAAKAIGERIAAYRGDGGEKRFNARRSRLT